MPIALGLVMELALDGVAIALLGLAIVAAVVPLGQLTAAILSRLPGPLAAVAGLGVSAIEGAIGQVVRWADASVNGLAHAIDYPFRALWTVQVGAAAAAQQTALSLWNVRFRVIPAVETAITTWVWTLYNALVTYSTALFQAERARADQEFTDAVRYTQAAVQQAEARADYEFGQAVQYAQSATSAAMARADQEFSEALQFTLQAVTQAEARADYEFGQAVAYTQAAVADAERFAERVGVAAEGFALGLEREAIDHADAAVAGAAAAAAAATAAVASRVSEIEDSSCQRYCSPLGDLGQFLQGLEDAGLAAALLGLAAAAARDSAGVGRTIAQGLGPLAQDLASAARQAEGV